MDEVDEIIDPEEENGENEDGGVWDVITDLNDKWLTISQAIDQTGAVPDPKTALILAKTPEITTTAVGTGALAYHAIDWISTGIDIIDSTMENNEELEGIDEEKITEIKEDEDIYEELGQTMKDADIKEKAEEIEELNKELLEYKEKNNLSAQELVQEKEEVFKELEEKNQELNGQLRGEITNKLNQLSQEIQEKLDEVSIEEMKKTKTYKKWEYYRGLQKDLSN